MDSWVGFLDVINPIKNVSEIKNLIKVPLVRQPDSYTCGVACVLSVLGYYGQDVPYNWLTKELKASDKNGVDHRDIIKFFKGLGYDVALHKGMLVSELMSYVDDEIPVIVCFQAWGAPVTLSESWENGHYAVVVGYDDTNLYLMDPSTLGNYTYIPIDEFVARWHDQDMEIKLRQSAIVVKGTRTYDSERIKKLN